MRNLKLFEQPDPYDPEITRFAVYGAFDRNDRWTFLSNHKTRQQAWEWAQQYLRHNGSDLVLESGVAVAPTL